MPEPAYLQIKIDRDSVTMADDIFSHEKTVEFPASGTILEFLQLVNRPPYLPGILGDQATWIVDLLGHQESCLGVVAQQWQQPRLTIPLTTPISDLINSQQSSFSFRYWCQADPERVFLTICNHTSLPDRYGRDTA